MADDQNQPLSPLKQPSLTNPPQNQPQPPAETGPLPSSEFPNKPPFPPDEGLASVQPSPQSSVAAQEPKITPPQSTPRPTPLPPPSQQAPSVDKPPPSPPPPPSSTPPPPAEAPQVKPPKKGGGAKKILIILALLLAVAAGAFLVIRILIPRLSQLRMPGQQVNLTYWGLWEPTNVMQDVIKQYEEENSNVKIEYVQQSHKEYRERLQSAIARGEGPDIFRFHNTWVPMFREELDRVPADVYSADQYQEIFYPVAVSNLRVGSSFVGIPLQYDGLALLYNKKIFSAAGKNPPNNWEELRRTAFDLTIRDQSGRIQTAGVALGITENIDHWPDILALMLLQNGADLKNPTDKTAADAILFYTIFSRSDKVWDATLPNSTQAFTTGKVAMIFAPSWRILEIQALNPDLDFGVIEVPLLPNTNTTWASYWVDGVSGQSQYTKEAWQFLKYLSSEETLQKLYQAQSAVRPFGEIYGRQDMSELLKDDPLVGAYVRQAPAARSWHMCSDTHDNGINERIIQYYRDAVNLVNARGETEKALATAAQGISEVLSQYRVE